MKARTETVSWPFKLFSSERPSYSNDQQMYKVENFNYIVIEFSFFFFLVSRFRGNIVFVLQST